MSAQLAREQLLDGDTPHPDGLQRLIEDGQARITEGQARLTSKGQNVARYFDRIAALGYQILEAFEPGQHIQRADIRALPLWRNSKECRDAIHYLRRHGLVHDDGHTIALVSTQPAETHSPNQG